MAARTIRDGWRASAQTATIGRTFPVTQLNTTRSSLNADVLKFCKAELLDENYFHAVFEATKSIAAKIRTLSDLQSDGADLVHQAFGQSQPGPVLTINSLISETEKGEQRGFANLLIGLFGTIRNPLAHNPKIEWDMSEQDALDLLTMASLIHRKLDKAHRHKAGTP